MKVSVNEHSKNNSESSKMQQSILEARSFYNKHFPTDRRTYNLRIPFVGLILSILMAQYVAGILLRYYLERNMLILYCYVFAACGVSYELYYGLKIGDRKQYTPWIILKVIETCLIVAAIVAEICNSRLYFRYHTADFIYGLILIVLNMWVTFVVISKSIKQFRGPPAKPVVDENIYDSYDNV